jgi:hypothetical protein
MGSKTFLIAHFGQFQVSSSVAIFIMPLLFILPDVVVEVYGRSRAQSIVFSGLLSVALLVLFTAIVTHLSPTPRFASSEGAYDRVFGYSVRLAIASLSAFAVSELLDITVFSRLRLILKHRALWLRSLVANVLSQFTDSAIFLTLAFYSIHQGLGGNVMFLIGLLLPYWLLRCTLNVLETPLVYAGVWLLRQGADRSEEAMTDAR